MTTSRKKTPEVTAPGFSFCVPLGYAFFLATAIIAYAVVKIKYATFYKKVIRKHEKKSSVYAGLMQGAIYSTLLENDIETYRHPNKREPSVVAATEGSLVSI